MDRESVRGTDRVPHGGEPDTDLLDFSANTNPRTPDGTREVYEAALDEARRYPDDGYPDYRSAAAAVVDCDPEQVVPTPGGLAAIRLAVATRVSPGNRVLLPAPSFGEYAREVRLQGGRPAFVAHDAVVETDPEEYAMAVVCTPNNPTGEAVAPDRLRAFAARCRAADTELLVDEAFHGYTELDSLAGTPGVVVARSLTKLYGLPGIRAGYAVATGDRLDDLLTARRAWALSTPAARVGAHCLRQDDFVAATRAAVDRERARLRTALATGYDVAPSDAPFLLLDARERDADAVVEEARERGVAIRDATTFRGLDTHVRVAVKDRAANDRLLEAMGVRDDA
jgi:L-threonine-O-3-phosphate decarboxylase